MHEPLTTQLLGELLSELHLAFPRGKSDPAEMAKQASVYRNALTGLSGDSVREAVRRSIQQDLYFPKVSKLREYAQGYERSRTVTLVTRAGEWGVCPTCNARVQELPYYAMDKATGKLPIGPDGKLVYTVKGYRQHIIHDPRAHGIRESQEGAA